MKIVDLFLSLIYSSKGDFKIKLRAYYYIIINLKNILNKKKEVRKMRKVPDKVALKYLKPVINVNYLFKSQREFKKSRDRRIDSNKN